MAKFMQFMILQLPLLLLAGLTADKSEKIARTYFVKGTQKLQTVSDVASAAAAFKSTLNS